MQQRNIENNCREDNAMELHTILGNDFYVFGNIHENSELLEGKNDV